MFELTEQPIKPENPNGDSTNCADRIDKQFFHNEINEMWLKVDDTILWTYMIVRTNSHNKNINNIRRQSTNLMCHLFYMHYKLNALFTAILDGKSKKDLLRLHSSCLTGWNRCVHFKEAMYSMLPIQQWADAVISPSKPFSVWNFVPKSLTGSFNDIAFNMNTKLVK